MRPLPTRHGRCQFVLAHRHFIAKDDHVEAALLGDREHFPFFFLDVVLDLFAQHFYLGVVEVVFRIRLLQLRDQVLGVVVLGQRVIEQNGRFLAFCAQ